MPSRLARLAGLALGAGAVAALLYAERARPLRRQRREAAPRIARNLTMGAACQLAIMAAEQPLSDRIAARNVAHRRGLAGLFGPGAIGNAAAFLAMDYGFYLWHIATHKLPFLWRFHRVHHVDPDMDASTALRFHFLDMFVSLPWRLVQVRLSGIGPRGLAAWRQFFLLSVLFHHSNWRLPRGLDEALSKLITTPRMHGIHHSQRASEMDSNWSSGIALWDHLHGTFRDDVAPETIVIGVDDPLAERDTHLLAAHKAPFATHAERSGLPGVQ